MIDRNDTLSARRRIWWLCAGYTLAHLLAHFAAYWFEVSPGITISVWYPPAGLGLALMMLLGPRAAALVFLVNFATAWITPHPRVPWTAVFFPAMITACYAATAWWARRRVGSRLLPGDARETAVFCLAVGVAPLVPALIGTAVVDLTLLTGHRLDAEEFWHSVFSWWVGDACGALVVVPAAMVFLHPWLAGRAPEPEPAARERGRLPFALLRAATLLGTLTLVVTVPTLRDHSAFYLCFLPLIWICLRHGLRGATLATLALMIAGLVCMRLAGTTRDFSHVFMLFEVAVAVVGLGLGTLVQRRERAERALAESRARLDRVVEGARLGVWEWDQKKHTLEGNPRTTAMLGYAPGDLYPLEKHIGDLIHPADMEEVRKIWREHLAGQRDLFEAEIRLRTRDGDWRWVQSRGSIMERAPDGRPLRISGTQIDVTDRKHAQAEAARLSRIVEASPDFILTLDDAGRVLYANHAFRAVFGGPAADAPQPEHIASRLPAVAARWRDEAMPAALRHGSWQGEGELPLPDGRSLPVSQVMIARHDDPAGSIAYSLILRDLSDQKLAEEERARRDRELLQMQKSESLGVLAGGIAHDFNNLLTAIMGNANLARLGLGADAPAQDHLDNIERAAGRAARLCQQMLAYAGRTPVATAEVELGALARDVWRLLSANIGPDTRVIFEHGRPARLLAAEAQLQQVAMNLVINAAEAIGERGGVIAVRTRAERLDEAAIARLFPGRPMAAGDYALLEVEDDGPGMPPEVRARIFEPFFTTKFTGKGLGLAAVAGVVKSHRGHLWLRSAPGEGTLFRLAFPALAETPAPMTKPTATPNLDTAPHENGAVLLVDDDPLIREVGAGLLRAMGFTPITAEDGVAGVAQFREHAGRVRAVLLDLTMPRMDGFAAHTEMHRIDPRVPVVLMSGFSSRLENLPPEAIHPAAVLAKPFSLAQLRERLLAVTQRA